MLPNPADFPSPSVCPFVRPKETGLFPKRVEADGEGGPDAVAQTRGAGGGSGRQLRSKQSALITHVRLQPSRWPWPGPGSWSIVRAPTGCRFDSRSGLVLDTSDRCDSLPPSL